MNIIVNRLMLLAVLGLSSMHASSSADDSTRQRRWFLPHYIPIQFAGNTGLFSTGAGFSSRHQNYHLDLLYGYVPKSVGGAVIHTVTAKNYFPIGGFQLKRGQTLILYLGLGVSLEIGGLAFFRTPDHLPDGYYDFPKNLHGLAYGGVRLQRLFESETWGLRGIEFYAETGTVDVYIWYKMMSREIRVRDIFSLALGMNLLLDR